MDDAEHGIEIDAAGQGPQSPRRRGCALRLASAEIRTAGLDSAWPPVFGLHADAPSQAANTAGSRCLPAPRGLSAAMLDRLALGAARIEAIAKSRSRRSPPFPDPVGREMARWTPENGLDIARVSTPIGVIAMIYEARPNVTADAAALCVRSGNAVILRGGSECLRSSLAIHAALGGRAGATPDLPQSMRADRIDNRPGSRGPVALERPGRARWTFSSRAAAKTWWRG